MMRRLTRIAKFTGREEKIDIKTYQKVFAEIPEAMRIIDSDFNVVDANKEFLKLANLSKDEVVGCKCYDSLSCHKCNTNDCPLKNVEHDSSDEIVKQQKVDGQKIACITSSAALKEDNDNFYGIAQSFRDIEDLYQEKGKDGLNNWVKKGQDGLIEALNDCENLTDLSKNVTSCLAKHINAHLGVFYFSEDDTTLKFLSSYAYSNRKNVPDSFQIGEGIIGQAAIEKEIIIISDIPEGHMQVSSGLTEFSPKNIALIPIYLADILYGVIELGSLKSFEERHLEFLNTVSEDIAIAINNMLISDTIENLVDESKKQKEEIENLNKVIESNEKDIKNLTAETEHQNHIIKEQRNAIENKNREIENVRAEVDMKAKTHKNEFLSNVSNELRTSLNNLQILTNSIEK